MTEDRRPKTVLILALIISCLGYVNCGYRLVKQDDYNKLHQEIKSLETQIHKLEEYINAQNVEQQAILKSMRAELSNLYGQLEQRMAHLDGKLDASRQDLKKLDRKTEELGSKQFILKKIKTGSDSASGEKDSLVAIQTKLNIEKLVNLSRNDFNARHYDQALKGFLEIIENYPNEPATAAAQYWVGECYYVQKKYKKATDEYVKTFTRHADSPHAPPALYKAGLAFDKLGDEKKKNRAWKKLQKDYPGSEEAEIVKERMAR